MSALKKPELGDIVVINGRVAIVTQILDGFRVRLTIFDPSGTIDSYRAMKQAATRKWEAKRLTDPAYRELRKLRQRESRRRLSSAA